MSVARPFFLGILVTIGVIWLVPVMLNVALFGFALVGAAAIVRKLVSIGRSDGINEVDIDHLKQAKKVNPESAQKSDRSTRAGRPN